MQYVITGDNAQQLIVRHQKQLLIDSGAIAWRFRAHQKQLRDTLKMGACNKIYAGSDRKPTGAGITGLFDIYFFYRPIAENRIPRKFAPIRDKNCCTVFAPPVPSDLAISPVIGVTNNMLNFLFICFCIWLTISAFTFHPLAGIALAAIFLSV